MRDLHDDKFASWIEQFNSEVRQPRHDARCFGRRYRIEMVREYLATHLGATAKDVANDLDLSYSISCSYIQAIRSEWRGKANAAKNTLQED